MSFQDQWADANPDAVGNGDDLTPPPDDTYTVALMNGDAFTAKSSGADFVKMAWKVVGGPHNDYEWTVLLGFKSQAQANMTKKQVRELGIDVDNIDTLAGLGEAIATKCGQFFDVTVKRDGKFENTYIDGPANGTQTTVDTSDFTPNTAAPPVPQTVPDDDIPF